MRTITKIIGKQTKDRHDGRKGLITTVQLDDGMLASGYLLLEDKPFQVGEQVEVYFHYNTVKIKRGNSSKGATNETE